MIWALRISLVSVTTAAMSFIGLGMLPGVHGREAYAAVAAVSIVLWLCLSPLVYRQSLGLAVSVGLMSPLIAVAPMLPIALIALLVDFRYWIIFPVGAVTGALVWACLRIDQDEPERPD
jgi:hypothetical protein